MDVVEVRARFQDALAGGSEADWYRPDRHNAETVGRRMLNDLPVVVSSSQDRLMAEGEILARAYTDRIRLKARLRGVRGI